LKYGGPVTSPVGPKIREEMKMYATMTDFWADRAQWMRDAFRKIIVLCQKGDFLAAAKIANMDGWM
jgi:hypothetical protein